MLLFDAYQQIYGPKITMSNLNEMASDLSRIAGRSRPWTGKFLHSLIKGYPGFAVNSQLAKALNVLTIRLAGFDEVQAQAREITVSAVNDLPAETVVLGQARRCAVPGCQVLFVATHPRQKYHSKSCAKVAQRLNRR